MNTTAQNNDSSNRVPQRSRVTPDTWPIGRPLA